MRGIHRGPVNSPQKRPVTREMFLFDDVIMPYNCYMRPCQPTNSRFMDIVLISQPINFMKCVSFWKVHASFQCWNRMQLWLIMTSSHGLAFHITDHLCGESTLTDGFPSQRANKISGHTDNNCILPYSFLYGSHSRLEIPRWIIAYASIKDFESHM